MGLVVNDIVAITYKGVYCNQQIRNTLHYRCTTPGNSANAESDLFAIAQDFAAPLTNQVTGKMQECAVVDMQWTGVVAQRVYPTRSIGMLAASSWPGTLNFTGLPANSSVVITKRTVTPGRPGIGSLHLTAYPQDMALNGMASNLAGLQALAAAMLAMHTVTAINCNLEPGIFNPTHPPSFFSRLFDAIPQPEIRTMRRRTVGLGI